MKRILNLARQNGKLMHVPHVPMLKERNVRTGFFEREQIEHILAHLPPAIRPAVQFGYIHRLAHPERGPEAPVPGPAHDEERRGANLPVHRRPPAAPGGSEGRTRAAESRRRDRSLGVQPLESQGEGKRITTFIKAFRAACTKAGCPGRIPHDLRRTAVRNLVRAGGPERVAMQMTGHKTRSVFERCNIVSECDLVEAAKKLNTLQPIPPTEVRLKPDTPSEDRDGHSLGTVGPDRGSRLRVSL